MPLCWALLVRKCIFLVTCTSSFSSTGDEPRLLLDVDAAGVSSALSWLNKYKLRRKLQISDVSSQYSVWAAFEGKLQAGGAGAILESNCGVERCFQISLGLPLL